MICNFYAWVFHYFGHEDNCQNYAIRKRQAEYGINKSTFADEHPDEMSQDAYDLIRKQSDARAKIWKATYLKELRKHIASCQEQAATIEQELTFNS